ncbi:hypothetical protein NPIL_140601 [Nephila pilipes]|uniref:Uncharacterized protein n=1 Tax=Nephila pilipes TaxID=299642 RepID=A0A8X6MZU6_NEPPI|nr:hypothetical protein NPIL_140601 [Nephila pilipes]
MNEREMEHGKGIQQRERKRSFQFIQMHGANRVTSATLPIDLGDLTFRTMLYEAAVTVSLGRRNLHNLTPPTLNRGRVRYEPLLQRNHRGGHLNTPKEDPPYPENSISKKR